MNMNEYFDWEKTNSIIYTYKIKLPKSFKKVSIFHIAVVVKLFALWTHFFVQYKCICCALKLRNFRNFKGTPLNHFSSKLFSLNFSS